MTKSAQPCCDPPGARVVACVVTFNRAGLLARLLHAVRMQSYPVAQVIVVDNASSDNTSDVVASEVASGFEQIVYVRLTENRGGAGGFAAAMELAMTNAAGRPTHLWLMDDDGYPDSKCLEHLLHAANTSEYSALNPVVWADSDFAQDRKRLAFPGGREERETLLRAVESGGRQCVPGLVRFFNGPILDARMVERAGTPISEFFIWGDELEYLYRIRRLGYSVATVANANYFHPKNRQTWRRYRVGPVSWVLPKVVPERRYYMIRNFAYIAHNYGGIPRWLAHTAKWLISGEVAPLAVLRWSTEGLMLSRRGPRQARWQRRR